MQNIIILIFAMLLIVLAAHGCHDRLLFANVCVCVCVRCVTETGREEVITASIYLLIARLVRFFSRFAPGRMHVTMAGRAPCHRLSLHTDLLTRKLDYFFTLVY